MENVDDQSDRTKVNSNWVTPKDGEVVGKGFDAKGVFIDVYDAKLRRPVRSYNVPKKHWPKQ